MKMQGRKPGEEESEVELQKPGKKKEKVAIE